MVFRYSFTIYMNKLVFNVIKYQYTNNESQMNVVELNSVWNKRSIIWDFAVTDLKLRYRNSVLGFAWTILEPLLILTVLYVVFTNIFESTIEHYPLYLLLGLIMWNMAVRGTQIGINSTLSRGPILTQINIPTEIPPISASITALFMLCFEMIVFAMFMIAFQIIPTWTLIILPFIIGLEFLLVLGLALPLSVVNIKFRDMQFIWGIIIHAGFFLTPIFYSLDILPEKIQAIIVFNPMVQILNIARDVTIYGELPSIEEFGIPVLMTFLIFTIGYGIYKKASNRIIEEL